MQTEELLRQRRFQLWVLPRCDVTPRCDVSARDVISCTAVMSPGRNEFHSTVSLMERASSGGLNWVGPFPLNDTRDWQSSGADVNTNLNSNAAKPSLLRIWQQKFSAIKTVEHCVGGSGPTNPTPRVGASRTVNRGHQFLGCSWNCCEEDKYSWTKWYVTCRHNGSILRSTETKAWRHLPMVANYQFSFLKDDVAFGLRNKLRNDFNLISPFNLTVTSHTIQWSSGAIEAFRPPQTELKLNTWPFNKL